MFDRQAKKYGKIFVCYKKMYLLYRDKKNDFSEGVNRRFLSFGKVKTKKKVFRSPCMLFHKKRISLHFEIYPIIRCVLKWEIVQKRQ